MISVDGPAKSQAPLDRWFLHPSILLGFQPSWWRGAGVRTHQYDKIWWYNNKVFWSLMNFTSLMNLMKLMNFGIAQFWREFPGVFCHLEMFSFATKRNSWAILLPRTQCGPGWLKHLPSEYFGTLVWICQNTRILVVNHLGSLKVWWWLGKTWKQLDHGEVSSKVYMMIIWLVVWNMCFFTIDWE